MPNLTTSADVDAILAAANKAAARTALGATMAGGAIFVVSNPDAVTFLRVNADNSVTLLSASDFRAALSLGSAALSAATDFATAAQGSTADSALQPAGDGSSLTGINPAQFGTGILAANITLGESTGQLVLDPALSADGKWSGIMEAGTAGATLAFGDLVYLSASDSRWELADASAASTSGLVKLGMCVFAAAADGDPTNILLWGKIRADAAFPTFTVSAPVYVSETAGDVTGTQPTTTDAVIRTIGFADTADSFLFAPSPDYMTHT